MTREEAIKMLKALNMMLRSPDGKPISDACDALDMAIEALKQPSDAMQLLNDGTLKVRVANVLDIKRVMVMDDNIIYDSYYPDRPKGEWLEVEVLPEVYDIEGIKTWGSEMQCDQCGFRHTAIEGHMAQYNYCPNCGSDMCRQ